MNIVQIFITNADIIGLGLTFIASFGWATQIFIESHKDFKGRVLEEYSQQQRGYKIKRDRNLIWLLLLCLGFLLQFIGSYGTTTSLGQDLKVK